MALEREDRVKDQTATTGTGTLTIAGTAPTGYRTITSAHTDGATVRYTVLTSDLTEWEVGQGVWSSSGTTLTRATVYASSNAGALVSFSSGTKIVFTGPVAADIDAPTQPLMNYGGYGFDGAADYLDGNALTGIADGKLGTMVIHLRFANAATVTERILLSTGSQFGILRLSTGNLQVFGENTAGTLIMSLITDTTPCAAAGTYVIKSSWDLNTAGTGRVYVNDVTAMTSAATYTNDTIDYTAAEYSIGASITGTDKVVGDIYSIWLDPTQRLDLDTTSVRRKFTDANNVPVFLGSNGELPTGTRPILFLAYDSDSRWALNRGSATTTFTINGGPGATVTALYGQQAPVSGVYTPTLTGVTNVGASTAYACQWRRESSATGGTVTVSGKVDIDPTGAGALELGISLPFASAFTAAQQCAGTAFSPGIASLGAAILADATNDRASLQYVAVDVTNQSFYFTFTYQIL